MMRDSIFTCGPFLSASLNVDRFSQNVYYNYLLASSLETYVEYENKLKSAIEQDMSDEHIANLEKESQYFSGLIDLAISVGANPDGEEIE